LLAGGVAVVTGGASGVGPAVCDALAARGTALAVLDPDPAALAAVVDRIRAGGNRAIGIETDCLRSATVDRARREVERAFGPADLLVALAPGFGADAPDPPSASPAEPAAVAHRLVATFLTARVFLPGMLDRGRGTILTPPALSVFARHLARGLVGSGVRIAAVRAPRPSPRPESDAGQTFAEAVSSLLLADPPIHAHVGAGQSAHVCPATQVNRRQSALP
jgi:3-oxoacyl-[acyl-carrier protein] reductase